MASNLTIDTGVIVTLTDDTENAVANLNAIISEIVTKVNTFMETHTHNGTDSPSVSAGIGSISMTELTIGRIMGGYE